MLNTLRAGIEIFTKKKAEFERTAKFGDGLKSHATQRWMTQNYTLSADSLSYWEMALAIISFATSAYAILMDHWGVAFYAMIFGIGLTYLSGLTLIQTFNMWLAQKQEQRHEASTQEVTSLSAD